VSGGVEFGAGAPACAAGADRECGGYRFRLHPPDVAKLRELSGARGKSDETLVAEFFDAQAPRWAESLAENLPAPAEVRIVVDPYSRQAFMACENVVYSILSF
jgi:hypothetical protein